MKVSNNKMGNPVGNSSANLDAAKLGKADAAAAQKNIQSGGLKSKADVKSSANVNVSERAQMMAKAKEIAGSPMSVDEAKVARLQKMIDEGRYKVDAEAIADRLVDEHMSIPD